MKRKIIITIVLATLLVVTLSLAGCAKWGTPYGTLDGEGYTVSVRFDANGGRFAGTMDVFVVDVFNLNNAATGAGGMKEIPLIAPDDSKRGDSAFEISRDKYFLAGWYTERTPRVNDAGEPLDDFGVPTSVSGRPQGYEYAGRWDFGKDKLSVDPAADHSSAENAMTLYAGWIPYFTFDIYAPGESGEWTLLGSELALEMTIPTWNERTGKLDMKRFPTMRGYTLEGVFADSALTEALTDKVGGAVDLEKGIAATEKITLYTTWRAGEWFRIYEPKHLFQLAKSNGCYEIMTDLDFTGATWPTAFSTGSFSGTMEGNGHKISNVTVLQADYSQNKGGLFGSLEAGAALRNITFENAVLQLKNGSRIVGAQFGLLAGGVSASATLEQVVVRGKVLVSRDVYEGDYTVGLLFGSGEIRDIDISGITAELTGTDPAGKTAVLDVDPATGEITVTFEVSN